MPQSAILSIILIFSAAITVIVLSKRIRIPPVIGFILTGLIWGAIAPSGLTEERSLRLLSELGVVFLLFMVGLEFSPDKVRRLGRTMLVGGSVQAALTVAAALLLVAAGVVSLSKGILGAFIVIQSSTAIALKVYQDRGEINAPHAEVSIGISLFQDITTVVLLIIIPLLGARAGYTDAATLMAAGRNLLLLGAFAAVAYVLFPVVLRWVVITGIRELVVLLTLVLCLGFAQLSQALGFSMALGAFICGVLLNRSEYHPQIIADTTSFRDVFLSLFFISIGLRHDWSFAAEHFGSIIAITFAVLLAKTAILFVSARVAGFPFRTSMLTGVGLSNIGEFGFIIMFAALPFGLISDAQYQTLGSAAVYSMLLTPLLIIGAIRLTLRKGKGPPPAGSEAAALHPQSRIIIIVGFGLAGRHLARVLKSAGISYGIIEANAKTVSQARSAGEPIIFGDATQWEIFERSGVKAAQALAILISDPTAMKACIGMAKRMNRDITVICRVRRMTDLDPLLKAGADEVISEEFETSIELFTRVLNRLHVPRNIIRSQTIALREDGYEMLRVPSPIKGISDKLAQVLAQGTTDVYQVMDGNFSAGKSLQELGLRSMTGATVLSVVRGQETFTNPPPDLVLQSGDSLVMVGSHGQIDAAFDYLESGIGA